MTHIDRDRELFVKRTQGTGCAAGGFPSGLGWEVRLSCLCVSWVGLAWSGYRVEFVYWTERIKNEIKQLVSVVVLVGSGWRVSWSHLALDLYLYLYNN